jgi:hypothetical protein
MDGGTIFVGVGALRDPGQVAASRDEVGVRAPVQQRQHTLRRIEFLDPLLRRRRGAGSLRRRCGVRPRVQRAGLAYLVLVHAQHHPPLQQVDLPGWLGEDHLATERSPMPVEIRVGQDGCVCDVGDDRAAGAMRPRLRHPDDRLDLRLQQVRAEALQ